MLRAAHEDVRPPWGVLEQVYYIALALTFLSLTAHAGLGDKILHAFDAVSATR